MSILWQPPRLFSDIYPQHADHGEEHAGSEHAERKITWLELFFDLVYVATLIQLGDALSDNVSLVGFLQFVLLFVPIWWSWTGITFYNNRFVVDDLLHRMLIFLQILAVAAMGISVSGAYGDLTRQFTLSYVAVRLVLVILYYRVALQVPAGREFASRYATGFLIAAAIWLVAAFVPAPYYIVFWMLGIVADFAVPLSPKSRRLNASLSIDTEHLAERYGIFIIIVLGESFVKVLSGLAGVTITQPLILFSLPAMVVIGGLWWLYFDDIASALVKPGALGRYIWIYSHLPLALALTATGVGMKKLILEVGQSYLPDKYRWLISIALILYLVFIALIDEVTQRTDKEMSNRARSYLRFGGAVAILLLAIFGGGLTSTQYIGIVALVIIVQLISELAFDYVGERAAV